MIRFFRIRLLFYGFLVFFSSCNDLIQREEKDNSDREPLFSLGITQGVLQHNEITEASGLAGGMINKEALWTHNDSGNKARLFLMTDKGQHLGEYFLENQSNLDWESMASGPGPLEGTSYLYVADIGGNWDRQVGLKVFRIPEPQAGTDGIPFIDTLQDSKFEVLLLRYPQENFDAECLLLDPLTKDLFIITKGEENERIFRAPYPQEVNKEILLEEVGSLGLSGITGGDVSADGMEILLKTYLRIFYWKREKGQSINDLLQSPSFTLPYEPELQGECIAWKKDGTGFFTSSEQVGNAKATLKFYARQESSQN